MAEMPNAIVITGIGMQSALGNAVTGCAAARAGISLARELDDLVIMKDDGSEVLVTGHAVESAAGFRGMGKLLTLAESALEDLLSKGDVASLATERTGFLLMAPDHSPEDDAPPRWTAQSLAEKLVARSALSLPSGVCTGISDDGAGFAMAIARAVAALGDNDWQRCIVGAVDSLLEVEVIEWLSQCDRLKTSERPDGLRPGEGAAFLLLERYDAATARGAEPMAFLRGCEVVEGGEGDDGVGLATAIARLLSRTKTVSDVWLLSDHNGETSSAADLGNARVRLYPDYPAVADATISFPAASFGDTAGAAGAIAMCTAATALARGYAPSRTALITCASNDDSRAAIRVDGAGA